VNRWNIRRIAGWIKLHAAVDVDTDEILAFVITTEHCGDVACLDKLMGLVVEGGHDVDALLADSAYDSKGIWNKYAGMGTHVCINIKSK